MKSPFQVSHVLVIQEYNKYVSPNTRAHILPCKDCGLLHDRVRKLFLYNHKPNQNLQNYAPCIESIGQDNLIVVCVSAGINILNDEVIINDLTL